jgi:hypothetical protein
MCNKKLNQLLHEAKYGKMIVVQLHKKFSSFYGNQIFITASSNNKYWTVR